MKIIVDPSRGGCTIWHVASNHVQRINDSANFICERIYKYCTMDYKEYEDGFESGEMKQFVEICLDACGYGMIYKDILENTYNLKVTCVKFLPSDYPKV